MMGLFDRFFRGPKKRISYPPALQTQIDRAMAGLQVLTASHDRLFQIGRAAWSVDQDTGIITFTAPNGLIATAPVQIVGSYNTQDETWLWGWDNPSLAAPLTEHAQKVRSFGQEHAYQLLTAAKLSCPEDQCWDLVALACMIAKAQGAYRGSAGATRVFMTFGSVKLSKAS